MKIVNREEFLKLENVIFAKYEPCVHGEISIMWGGTGLNDFVASALFGDFESNDSGEDCDIHFNKLQKGVSIEMELEETYRDGMFDDELFLIFEKEDIKKVINKLKELYQ